VELDTALTFLEWTLGLVALAALAARLHPRSEKRGKRAATALLLTSVPALICIEWGKHIEPSFPEVTHTRLPLVERPLRVVLLSDFHAGRMHRDDLAKAVRLANAESPELVLLAGDYISGYEMMADREAALEGLRGLVAPRGVFAIMGNHDSEPFAEDTPRRARVAEKLEGFGYRVLENQAVDLGSFWLVGLEDVQAGRTDVDAARRSVPANAKVVYLAHDWHALPGGPLDLGLVGHTHGGQVCVPFTDLCGVSRRDLPFVRGAYSWPAGGRLFVTRGVGLAKVSFRFACRPEVSVLELGK
jgi:predicted MPP superfamily phosphohydrolase